jgi:predicted hydrolase (HD superfamily)
MNELTTPEEARGKLCRKPYGRGSLADAHRMDPEREPAQACAGRGSLCCGLRRSGGGAAGPGGRRARRLFELYSTTALLHDFDYERHPSLDEHPFVGVRELERQGWPLEMRTAILGHAQYSGVPRVTHLDKCLFACDELAGFLTACALVKPSKAIADVEVASAQEDERQGVRPRSEPADVIQGAEELGVDLDAHIGFCLEAMKKRAGELGL